MKQLTPRTTRFLIFSSYLLIAVLFCGSLLYIGYNEIAENESYNIREKTYADFLNRARNQLNTAISSVQMLAVRPDSVMAAEAELKLRDYRRVVSDLLSYYDNTPSFNRATGEELFELSKRLHSAVFQISADISDESPSDARARNSTLIRMFGQLAVSADLLQSLVQTESESFENRQAQTVRFFSKMQKLIIVFFLASIIFSISAYVFFGTTLRRSLLSLSRGTKELRGGNLDFRFKDISPDEIGHVMYDFNMMARRIETQSSELRKANEELRDQAEKLIEAHQHKDRFLSNMSHELRTPLNSIIGFSELIGERAERLQPEKLKTYSSRILTAAEHLLELITSLLDLAKSGAGTLKPVFSNFNLAFAVSEMCAMLRPLAEKKGLFLTIELPPDLPVRADQRMMKQICLNLLSNAIKYTQEGGITVRLSQTSASYILEVEDTGIGIPAEEHKNIFKDFHRVDNGPKYAIDGVGIGLALSRRLAALHNGTISFRSEEGKGSTFILTLPSGETP